MFVRVAHFLIVDDCYFSIWVVKVRNDEDYHDYVVVDDLKLNNEENRNTIRCSEFLKESKRG